MPTERTRIAAVIRRAAAEASDALLTTRAQLEWWRARAGLVDGAEAAAADAAAHTDGTRGGGNPGSGGGSPSGGSPSAALSAAARGEASLAAAYALLREKDAELAQLAEREMAAGAAADEARRRLGEATAEACEEALASQVRLSPSTAPLDAHRRQRL